MCLYFLDENASRITLQRAKMAELEEERNEFMLENACDGTLSMDHQHNEVVTCRGWPLLLVLRFPSGIAVYLLLISAGQDVM